MVEVPKVVVNGFNSFKSTCSKYGWEAVTVVSIPTSAYFAYLFKNEWILDPYSNRRGIASAVVINTGVLCGLHYLFQTKWARYWQDKMDEVNKESAAQRELRESRDSAAVKKEAVEEAHIEISKIKHELDSATEGKQLKVDDSEKAYNKRVEETAAAKSRKNEFVDNELYPFLMTLDVDEFMFQTLETELKKEDRRSASRVRLRTGGPREEEALDPNIKYLASVLNKEDINFRQILTEFKIELRVTDFNFGQFIKEFKEDLLSIINIAKIIKSYNKDELKAVDFKIGPMIQELQNKLENVKSQIQKLKALNQGDLKTQIDSAEDNVKDLNTELARAQRKRDEEEGQINSEGDRRKSLEKELSGEEGEKEGGKEGEEQRLLRELKEAELRAAKLKYEVTETDYWINEEKLMGVNQGIVQPNPPRTTMESIAPGLLSIEELKSIALRLDIDLPAAKSGFDHAATMLETVFHEIHNTAKESCLFFYPIMVYWLENYEEKIAEIQRKQQRFIEESQKKEEDTIITGYNLTSYTPEQKAKRKEDRRVNIVGFYSDILKVFQLCKLTRSQRIDDSLKNESKKPTIALEIPDWEESTSSQNTKKKKLKKEVKEVIKASIFFSSLLKLINAKTKEGRIGLHELSYAFDELTEVLKDPVNIKKINKGVMISYKIEDRVGTKIVTSFGDKLLRLREAYESYAIALKKHSLLAKRNEAVRPELRERLAKQTPLISEQARLQAERVAAKKKYTDLNENYFKVMGQLKSVREQISGIRKKMGELESETRNLRSQIEKSRIAVAAAEKKVTDAKKELNGNKLKVKTNEIRISILKVLEAILKRLVPPQDGGGVDETLLQLFKKEQSKLETAQGLEKEALDKYREDVRELAQNSKELEANLAKWTEQLNKRGRTLRECEDESVKKEIALAEVERDDARLLLFKKIRKKAKAAVKQLYQWKIDHLKETTQQGLLIQNHRLEIIQAKYAVAQRKQEINFKRKKLNDSCSEQTALMDKARLDIRACQLKRIKHDQQWRVGSIEETRRFHDKTLELLQEEEGLVYQFFSNKILQLPRSAEAQKSKCIMQALYALVDVMTLKVFVYFIRHKDVRPIEYPNIIEKIQGYIRDNNKLFNDLREKAGYRIDLLKELNDALDLDTKAYLDRKAASPLDNFYNALIRLIDKDTYDNIHSLKLPLIKSRIDLIKLLSAKPYKTDKEYEGKFQNYQQAINRHRGDKYELKKQIESHEKKWIENKQRYKTYKRQKNDAKSRRVQSAVDAFAQTYFFDKLVYLIPTAILLIIYEAGFATKLSSLIGGVLSRGASRVVLCIMSMVHLYLQSSFPRTYNGEKKLEPGTPGKHGMFPPQSDSSPPASPAAAAAQKGPPVSVVPAV